MYISQVIFGEKNCFLSRYCTLTRTCMCVVNMLYEHYFNLLTNKFDLKNDIMQLAIMKMKHAVQL